MIKIIIVGFTGKMGQTIYNAVCSRPDDMTVVAGIDVSVPDNSPIPVYTNINDVKEKADCIIDFSRPEALKSTLPYCKEHKLFAVIGTTGLSDEDKALMDSYAMSVPIFTSGNMSLGVNLQLQLVKTTAATLGLAYEPEIVEKHHHLKVDAPSGTALMLADSIKSQYNEEIKTVYGRYTKTERRKSNELGIHSVRGGTIVGEHECYFIGTDEILEVNHRAYSKQIFAQGALRAAVFMKDKLPGIYSMQDIVLDTNVPSKLYATGNQAIIMIKNLKKNDLGDIFSSLGDSDIFVDMISISSFNEVGFSLASSKLYDAVSIIDKMGKSYLRVSDIDGITKISIEGLGMESSCGIAAQVFEILENAQIEPLLVTTAESKIAVAVEDSLAQTALSAFSAQLEL